MEHSRCTSLSRGRCALSTGLASIGAKAPSGPGGGLGRNNPAGALVATDSRLAGCFSLPAAGPGTPSLCGEPTIIEGTLGIPLRGPVNGLAVCGAITPIAGLIWACTRRG
jgi:hypothetical protein